MRNRQAVTSSKCNGLIFSRPAIKDGNDHSTSSPHRSWCNYVDWTEAQSWNFTGPLPIKSAGRDPERIQVRASWFSLSVKSCPIASSLSFCLLSLGVWTPVGPTQSPYTTDKDNNGWVSRIRTGAAREANRCRHTIPNYSPARPPAIPLAVR